MKDNRFRFASMLTLIFIWTLLPAAARSLVLSQDWRFHKGDIAGGETTAISDSAWRTVVVPHDFSIEDRPDGNSPFDPETYGGANSGYIPGGIGWYRRHLLIDPKDARSVISLRFEAVYMDADVWVNGVHLAKHHYGYTGFEVDLTSKVHIGDNVIAVRVNHEDSSSRWYAGSGIIRPVSLTITPLVHIDSDGPTIVTPSPTATLAKVQIATPVVNRTPRDAKIDLMTAIVDSDGKIVARSILHRTAKAGEHLAIEQALAVRTPKLWNTDSPNLYRLSQTLQSESGKDEHQTTFGIRDIRFDAEHGLLVNGKRVVLRGGNIHHDVYMLGAAGFPRAEERKLEWMKAAGYNAVRSAHNPMSQASLDAADRLGMFVIDEAFDSWMEAKQPKDYSRFFATNWQDDLRSLVVSGRNHPSVLMWSIGNEVPEQAKPEAVGRAAMLAGFVHALDPTRPVTQAVNVHSPDTVALFGQLDISGYNYLPQYYGSDHAEFPKRMMYATESFPDKVFDSWTPTRTMPWVLGDFVWTAVDYMGEASIGWTGFSKSWKLGPYPWHLAWCGEIDAIGRLRPNAYYRQIVWGNSPHPVAAFVRWPAPEGSLPFPPNDGVRDWTMQDLHPSWTWPGYEGKPLAVVVYSELPEVELFLNGRSLGRKQVSEGDRYQTEYSVPYEAGNLKAIGYRGGKAVSEWKLETAGAPVAVRLSADRTRIAASGTDLSFITAELVDAQGRATYSEASDKRLTFSVEGAGVLAGVGNGKPYGTESFQSGVRTTYHGEAVAVVRAGTKPGNVVVKVSADGLPSQQLVVQAK